MSSTLATTQPQTATIPNCELVCARVRRELGL